MDKYQLEMINAIKRLRAELNLSQAKFAELCDVSTGTIGNIECGLAKPSFDLIVKMASVLGVSPAMFFSESEETARNFRTDESKMILIEIYGKIKSYLEN